LNLRSKLIEVVLPLEAINIAVGHEKMQAFALRDAPEHRLEMEFPAGG
jgi:hypothetical protein